MAAPKEVNIRITLRGGETETISQPLETESVSYTKLVESLSKVQEKCNQVLTKAVEKEKQDGLANVKNDQAKEDNSDDDNDDDSDDEDENDKNSEPPQKKHKS